MAQPGITRITSESTLAEAQEYIWRMNQERGFNLEDPEKKMLMLTEEVGEVARAVRKLAGGKFDDATHHADLAEEIADVFIVLSGLASMMDIDLAQAIEAKEVKNRQRTWR